MLKMCFIGHRNINIDENFKVSVTKLLEEYITKRKITIFLFGSYSDFDSLCYDIISKLKEKYPFIKRIYYMSYDIELTEKIKNNYLLYYEDIIVPYSVKNSGRLAYVRRNQSMINDSDVCIFYYDKNKNLQRKSGSHVAYEYATKQHKEIINVFDTKKD